ncbi:MAG: type II toxin-antitoxin system RelE/ParE family toxin [Gemmatimonadetes bacterium]|nr:type II toxin-antitoxin system RelE/ParE family toxin [Gemmatimonadota bacterium]
MRAVQFHPEARRELRAAAEFYRDERPGLGRAFVAEVRAAAARTAEFPQSGSAEVTDIRSGGE